MDAAFPPGRRGAMAIEGFRCIGDDGRFCVVRLTVAEAGTLDADPVLLLVSTTDGERRFVPTDAEDDDRSADFLLPSSLRRSEAFAVQIGRERLTLPAPAEPEHGDADVSAIAERAYVAHQEELADQADRLVELRSELRRQHQRTSAAEDARAELEHEVSEASTAAGARDERLGRQLAEARQRVADLEKEANEIDDRRESLQSQVADVEAAIVEERAARAEAEERAKDAARETDAMDERRQQLEAELAEARSALQEALAARESEAPS